MPSKPDVTRFELAPLQRSIEPTCAFLAELAARSGVDDAAGLVQDVRTALSAVVDRNIGRTAAGTIEVLIADDGARLTVKVANRGVPLFELADLTIENLGKDGQVVLIERPVGTTRSTAERPDRIINEDDEVLIRPFVPGEERRLIELFYYVYGYNYINEYVYHPDALARSHADGTLQGVTAELTDGTMVGYLGLLRWNENPLVFEPCLGVVDPAVSSRGLFRRIVDETMTLARQQDMHYCIFDFVTNHVYSQKLLANHGVRDLALFVGSQSSATQAKLSDLGVGEDPAATDRYSMLVSVVPGAAAPFGTEVVLPDILADSLGFLLESVGVVPCPPPRFQSLPRRGVHSAARRPDQSAVVFDFAEPGRANFDQILNEWTGLLRSGYQYAAIDVPLGSPGLAHVHDFFTENGFFVAGFVPYHYGARLCLRLQCLGHTRISFDEIKIHGEQARRLLKVIEEDYARNTRH